MPRKPRPPTRRALYKAAKAAGKFVGSFEEWDDHHSPGVTCPNCGQVRAQPKPLTGWYLPMHPLWQEEPHESPYECVQYLKNEIADLRSEIGDLRSDVRAPRIVFD